VDSLRAIALFILQLIETPVILLIITLLIGVILLRLDFHHHPDP